MNRTVEMPKDTYKDCIEVAEQALGRERAQRWLNIVKFLTDERDYQDWKWGLIEDNPKNIRDWLSILDSIVCKAYEALDKDDYAKVSFRVGQLMATSAAVLEQIGVVFRDGGGPVEW